MSTCLHDWGWGIDGTCPNCGADRPKSPDLPTTERQS